ncbi:MAG: multidrug ABC transporter permease [Oceanicaulis sp.]|jgi:ABC-2 type transport system permease protein|uniref:ABC transporter permease n=2 Tax=unclassified Oceanicaulis TaxID=2632123 RepID=UPI000066A2A4|nr:ABC transporter permease [Oceanicaulis sp. HTCC2633]MAB70776.1 multidrug ABC transporter permease [Oceanicaulis sp.]EAP89880.1 ABC-2 type transporter [Oceanicaulis sp. HTCC2633]MBG36008.1 multidrug ABC transporter permease [Oceanicaulis sp.]MBI75858.1 multidrug ABC transporter permease [Oceanicaulis sp.]HBU62710.1 multidrug ABC transporter permease [Oceanicaulis sp.]|tara:strand:+ start:324 stop:1160 length:837 start_codon:yes stop_codon:yes gene_type:complete
MSDQAASAPQSTDVSTIPQPRPLGAVNWLGLWTLYKKEVRRFLKVSFQTVLAPVATTLLYMIVFSLAIGSRRGEVMGVDFTAFVAPGLIMLGMLNNSFANSSSSLIVAKVQGNTVDFLMPPLSPGELAAAFIGGAVTRGVIVGAATALAVAPFVDVSISHLWAMLYFGLSAAAMMSMIGLIAGLWAEKFDHLAVITNFIIMPLAFLSGTFYSVEILPEPFYTISHVNPVFFMIDGFRYGFIGAHDSPLLIGGLVVLAINAALLIASYLLLRSGWRLKS